VCQEIPEEMVSMRHRLHELIDKYEHPSAPTGDIAEAVAKEAEERWPEEWAGWLRSLGVAAIEGPITEVRIRASSARWEKSRRALTHAAEPSDFSARDERPKTH
jgi:hypothetical protein